MKIVGTSSLYVIRPLLATFLNCINQGIPPSSLPKMFQASLEPVLLSSILQHFKQVIDLQIAAPDDVRNYLVSLSKVQRFGTIMLFMNKDEKIILKGLWETCGKLDK
jgi:hypothetical protein